MSGDDAGIAIINANPPFSCYAVWTGSPGRSFGMPTCPFNERSKFKSRQSSGFPFKVSSLDNEKKSRDGP